MTPRSVQRSGSGLKALLDRFMRGNSGATAIEYGLIAALMAVTIIASLELLNRETNGMYGTITDRVVNAHQSVN